MKRIIITGMLVLTLIAALVGCGDTCEHTYDNACDTTCNDCLEERVLTGTHTPAKDDGDCTTPIACVNCGAVTTPANAAHTPKADDGDCTTPIVCVNCGAVTTPANAAHTPKADDGDCTTHIECAICGKITTSAKTEHISGADDGDCTTAVYCTACDTVTVAAKAHDFSGAWGFNENGHFHSCQNSGCDANDTPAGHISGGAATETEAEKCTVCDFVITPALGHTHNCNIPKYNETHHWLECVCGEKAEITAHEAMTDDGNCTTAVTCKACPTVLTAAKAAHEAGEDDGDCTTPIKCKNCNENAIAGNEMHIANTDDGDCTTAVTCTACPTVLTAAKAAHEAGEDDGDCTTAVKCNNCTKDAVVAYASHTEDSDGNCKTRHICSRCSSVALEAKSDHTDTNGDYLCDNEGCKTPLESVVVEIAKAFDRQGAQIPYDQLNARRSIYSTPEDATAQRTLFLDCSSYVNSIYREAFGVNIMPYEISAENANSSPSTKYYDAYARDYQSNDDVIGYWIPTDYSTIDEREKLADSIYANLQVGDILNYRHGQESGTKGHVYIYIGNDTFMHCAGAGSYVVNSKNPSLSYDSNATEIAKNGTIGTITFDNIFRVEDSSRYIFKKTDSDTVYSFCIIRPMARGLVPTEKTVARMAIAGMSMEKTASVCENSTVFSGSLLTYTVTLENTSSNAYTGIVVRDILPVGVEFVSSDTAGTVNGNKLEWTVSVAAKTTVKINYTVRITATDPGALIVSDQTYVSKIKLGSITHTVSLYSGAQQALIGDIAVVYGGSKEFSDTIELIKAVYAVFGIELFDEDTAGEILDLLIDTEGNTCRTDTELSRMLVPNMYGGLDIRYGWMYLASENERTRLPKEEHLAAGDIIVADWDNTDENKGTKGSTVYFYAGNKTLVSVENGVCTLIEIGEDIYTSGVNKIISLLGYDRYAVLRPSMVTRAPEVSVSEIVITSNPTKMEYLDGETFDPTGMVVSARLSSGEIKQLVNYEVSIRKITKNSKTVEVKFGELKKTFDVEVSEDLFLTSVSDARGEEIGTAINVAGIVVGVAHEGKSNDMELLIKDLVTDDIMAVREIPKSYGTLANLYGYSKGDVINIKVTVCKDSSSSTCYELKKYLEFSSENGSKASTIVSHIDNVTYNLDNVTVLSNWADMQEFFDKKQEPYTYVKISGEVFMQSFEGSDPVLNYRVHNNPDVTTTDDTVVDGKRRVTIRDDVMTAMYGEKWEELLVDINQDGISDAKGVNTGKEFYAVYIGGNGSYYQLVILDDDWISTKTAE